MRKKLIFPILAILLLTPWPVAYAYDNGMSRSESIQIKTAEPSATPIWKAFGGAIGGVATPADLFYIDATNNPADTSFTLYLTNAEELIHSYRYLTLKVGIYIETAADQWKKAVQGNGQEIPDTYLTMHNGGVNFMLPGYARYKVAIDGGCFYGLKTEGDSISPTFYLAAE